MILGAGTVALDTVETPAGSVRDVPGGSALYFAAAASSRVPVAVVGVTGDDFPGEPLARLAARGVDVRGIRRHPLPSFRWHARYDAAGEREILSVHRGGIVRESPEVPHFLRNPRVLFLGSTDPGVQASILEQAGAAGTVMLDTMPHWIRGSRSTLDALLPRVDVLLLSEDEVRILGGEASDEGTAAEAIRHHGPAWVVVKRGARGACAYGPQGRMAVDAARVEHVVDPTGAGDAFAGGLATALAEHGGATEAAMEEGLRYGALMGARAVEAFSLEGLLRDDGPEPRPVEAP